MKSCLLVLKAMALFGVGLFASQDVLAIPYSYYYLKEAHATNNSSSGTSNQDIFFSTPVAGIQALGFTQPSETVTVSSIGSTSATSTYSAGIAPGKLTGYSSSTTTGNGAVFAIGEGLSSSAEQVLEFRDTITPTSSTLGAGSPISLTLTLNLDALLSFSNVPTSNPALCSYGQIVLNALVNTATVAQLFDNLCDNSPSKTVTANFNAVVDTPFDFNLHMDIFTQSAIGASDTLGSGVTIDALHTGEAFLATPTGVQLDTASGATYQQTTNPVPEPSVLSLMVLGALLGSRFCERKQR